MAKWHSISVADNATNKASSDAKAIRRAAAIAQELTNYVWCFDHLEEYRHNALYFTQFERGEHLLGEMVACNPFEIDEFRRLRKSVVELRELLNCSSVWKKLCLANAYPATISDSHAPNYCAAALQGVESRFATVLAPDDREFDLVAGTHIEAFINESIEILADQSEMPDFPEKENWDWEMAKLQIEKEVQRATGRVLHSLSSLTKLRGPGRREGLTDDRRKRLAALQKLLKDAPELDRNEIFRRISQYEGKSFDLISKDKKWLKDNDPIDLRTNE